MRPQLDQTKFHPIRHDRLVQEQVHDTYKSKHKPVEPMRCPQCGAVFVQVAGTGEPLPRALTRRCVRPAIAATTTTRLATWN